MGFLKKANPRTPVEVMQSTHGHTYVTWPTSMAASGDLPGLPLGHSHIRSRQWVMADKTVVLILPGDPAEHAGGVIRHTYNVVSSHWNQKTKALATVVEHPSDPEINFVITTTGAGCACTQGPAGNAGPIGVPYQIHMVNPASSTDYDWFTKT